jgi:hypothetical protein
LESEISSAVSSRWVNLSQQSRVNFAQRYSREMKELNKILSLTFTLPPTGQMDATGHSLSPQTKTDSIARLGRRRAVLESKRHSFTGTVTGPTEANGVAIQR